MPKVSIIVPNYNHARYLHQRFDSIFNQTYHDYEIIILDDCSTDNSQEIIEQYRNHPKVSHIIYNEVNGGTSYKQWYKGIEYAKGELIWIAESDDISHYQFLEILVPHFENKEVSIAFSCSLFFFIKDEIYMVDDISGVKDEYDGAIFIKEFMLDRNKLYNASMLVFRKDVYDSVKNKGFSRMRLCGDWLLWTQILKDNRVVGIPEKLNYCRKHESNATSALRRNGLDFIEGLTVLKFGKTITRGDFDRIKVYQKWRDNYLIYSRSFYDGVRRKILLRFFTEEPLLFLYLNYKSLRSLAKKIFA